jgi:elongation factor P
MNGKIVERNFHQSESFEEADLPKEEIKYLYNHRDEFWFSAKNNPAQRFTLKEENVGVAAKFLKPNTLVTAIKFNDQIISVSVPIKMDLKIKEAPPNIAGDSAKSGTKKAILETGAEVDVPLFVNTGDTIRVNTELGTYTERVEKGKKLTIFF